MGIVSVFAVMVLGAGLPAFPDPFDWQPVIDRPYSELPELQDVGPMVKPTEVPEPGRRLGAGRLPSRNTVPGPAGAYRGGMPGAQPGAAQSRYMPPSPVDAGQPAPMARSPMAARGAGASQMPTDPAPMGQAMPPSPTGSVLPESPTQAASVMRGYPQNTPQPQPQPQPYTTPGPTWPGGAAPSTAPYSSAQAPVLGGATAQQPAFYQPSLSDKPFSTYRAPSPISPYMNLFRTDTNNGTVDNYTTLVRPQLEQRTLNQQFGGDISSLNSTTRQHGAAIRQIAPDVSVGAGLVNPQYFINYQQFYPSAPQNSGGGR